MRWESKLPEIHTQQGQSQKFAPLKCNLVAAVSLWMLTVLFFCFECQTQFVPVQRASKHSSKFSSRSGLSLQRIEKINLCLSRWAVAHPQLEKASLPNWFWVLLKCDLTHVWCTSCLAAANVASWGWRESQNVTNLIWGQLRKRVTFFQAIIPLSQLCEGSSVCYNSCSWYTRFFTSGHCALLKCNNFFVVFFFLTRWCVALLTLCTTLCPKQKYTHSGHTVVKLHWDTVPQQGGTLTHKECKGANSSDTQLWTAALKSKWITWSQICTIYNHINFWSDFLKGFMGDNNVSLKKEREKNKGCMTETSKTQQNIKTKF